MNENPEIMGRKVFFLYPHSVIQNDMLDVLLNNEFEVYSIDDHYKMKSLSKAFPESILFINIDDQLNEEQWEKYIKNYLEDDKMISRIGILTYNKDKKLAEKYLMEMMVPCGFIILSLSLEKSTLTILKTLMVNEAKGRRKYLRASNINSDISKLNFHFEGLLYTGIISDISIAGMAITIESDMLIPQNAIIHDIQLQLKGIICRVTGIVAAHRNVDNGSYVILFKKVEDLAKRKIHSFIYNHQQHEMKKITDKL